MVLNIIFLIKLAHGIAMGVRELAKEKRIPRIFLRDNPNIAKEIENKIISNTQGTEEIEDTQEDDVQES